MIFFKVEGFFSLGRPNNIINSGILLSKFIIMRVYEVYPKAIKLAKGWVLK